MELFLRTHRADRPAVDVRVDIDPEQVVARLANALARFDEPSTMAVPVLLSLRTGEVLDPAASLATSGVLSGDELVLDPAERPVPPPPMLIRAVSVDVLAGPDSGHSAVLDRGAFVLGRGDDCDLSVSDSTVSRRHLRVEVAADWTVTIAAEPEVENRVRVNDTELADGRSVVVGGDDVVALGATRLAFRQFIRSADEAIDQLGQIEFHRTPYRPERVQAREFKAVGPVPTAPEPRRFQFLAATAPLAGGLTMFAFSGEPQFLALTLLSPVAIVANFVEDRKSGRRRYTEQVRRFRERLAERGVEVAEALRAERIERVRASPDLADLARRAELRTIDLWPRGRQAGDFLVLRLGLGEVASLVVAPTETTGDDELLEESRQAFVGSDRLVDVPITLDVAEVGVVGIHGDPDNLDDTAAALAMQAACLHSPEDLIVAAALGPDRSLTSWLKWLPHTRSTTSPLAGRHLTTTREGARRLLSELVEVAERRAAERSSDSDRRWPWVLVFLDGDLEPDAALVSQLLERCPEGGVSVIWLSASEGRVPRQAAAVVDCQLTRGDEAATLWSTDPDVPPQRVELDRVHPDVADRVARALAPVRDATVATATTAIPRTAPLLHVLGVDDPDGRWVTERWLTNRPYGLSHPVGLGADGVFNLDLVSDGPHALIGGTSGAGKSELLQSMVASLITVYPPTRLNFLFVDYKGGASSTVFRDVPHTVGYVTNLDADLALRALTSLRAELNRRMRLLEGRAKDLEEMLARHPQDAPPSLVIVVDEFATLVKEIPDFVAGMVDIAQRGRSLGIHLILATQRPSGSVNDNILANTNLRLSLRMLDAADSSAVIRSPDAADIPVPLRGRGFARLGPRELVAFQSAFAGAPLRTAAGASPVVVEPFTIERTGGAVVVGGAVDAGGGHGSGDAATARTQLDAVVDAVIAASEVCAFPPPQAPWCEVLREHITIDELRQLPVEAGVREQPGRFVRVGVIDAPEQQSQYAAVVDLEDGGGLVVYGSGGSGRTSFLRTVALSAALDATVDEVAIFGLDFASRALRSVDALPHVVAIASGDDLEAVTRVIALLSAELDGRRRLLASAQAENATAYRQQGGALSRVLVLVDGYANLAAAFTGGGYSNPLDQWLDQFHRLVLDGRQVGLHVVLTADRRGGVPPLLQSAIANRVVLRQADESGYGDHGILVARARTLDLPPGRGLWQADALVQVACVSATGDGPAQAAAIQHAAQQLRVDQGVPELHTAPLPDVVATAPEPAASLGQPVFGLGVADLTLEPVSVDLAHSHFLIAGLPRSGRSTAALVAALGLRDAGFDVWAVGPAGSPLAALGAGPQVRLGRSDGIVAVLDELATVLAFPSERPRVLVVDDLDTLEDPSLSSIWERLVKADDLRVVGTIETRSFAGFSMNAMLNEVRKSRRSLFLQPDEPVEFFQLTGMKAPIRPGTPMPPGRGILVVDRRATLVQVARA